MVPLLPLAQVGVSAKQEIGVDSYTVNDSRNDQMHARISGDRAVWQDYRDIGVHTGDEVNADIYVYDYATRDEIKVTENHTASRPDISGDVVVFTDSRNGDRDIRSYNVRTDEVDWVARRTGSDQDRAAIDGNLVVWQDNRDGNWDIRGIDLGSDEEFWVSRREGNQTNPRISGRIVVWEDDRNGCCDIYVRDLDRGDVRRISDGNDAHEPEISGKWVVYRRGEDRASIYAYQMDNGETIRLNTTREDRRTTPSIDGRLVVWSDQRNGEDFNILGFNLDTREEFLIARGDSNELEPAISGNRVVWTEERGDRGDNIRGANLTLPSPAATPTPTGTVPNPPPAQGPCTFILGFSFLRDQTVRAEGNIVGDCQENEWHNPMNGDGLQRTSGRGTGAVGMFAWRKADNWTAYTDGYTTWLWGPCGLQKRLNTGPYFNWEGRQGAPCS